MADWPTVAMESRKQAARRPDHRHREPGQSLLPAGSQVDVVRFQHITHLLIPAKVQQIVARQAANQEFHRDIVDVTLAFDGLRHGLSIQLLCERPAHRLPPLVRRHLVCSMKAKNAATDASGQPGIELC